MTHNGRWRNSPRRPVAAMWELGDLLTRTAPHIEGFRFEHIVRGS